MEGDNVRVVDDGSSDGYEPWNPARSWWVVAVAAVGLVSAGVLLGWALGSSGEPADDTLGTALAVASTTAATSTTMQPSTTITTLSTATTTVWWGSTDAGAVLQANVRAVCERASPASVDGLQTRDEWYVSLFVNGEWVYYHLDRQIGHRLNQARLDQDARLVDTLELLVDRLEQAETASDNLLRFSGDEGSDEWTNLVALAERHCAAATATIVAMRSE